MASVLAKNTTALRISAVSSTLPSAASRRFPSFEEVALSAPTPRSLFDLSTLVGCDLDLLVRVDAHRQGLPRSLVAPIAQALGVQPGEVEQAAGRVVEDHGDARALSPMPPDRARGEPLFLRPVAPTKLPVFGA